MTNVVVIVVIIVGGVILDIVVVIVVFVYVVVNMNVELYRWQERDFELTSLTDDSWANVVFRSRPSAPATKTRKGFSISYLGSKKKPN